MNTLLAIETSGSHTSVAGRRQDALVFRESFTSGRRETGPLFSLVRSALEALEVFPEKGTGDASALDGIVVGTGPGSYNGLRAGLALAAGLGLALKVPVGGWSSLLGLPSGRWVACGDARGGQWFLSVVADGVFLEEPHLCDSGNLGKLPGAQGAQEIARERARQFDATLAWLGETPPSAEWEKMHPAAENLLRVADGWLVRQVPYPPAPELWPAASPLYLKEPCITVAKTPAHQALPGSPAK